MNLYRDLSWLPRPPADFLAQCRGIPGAHEAAGLNLPSIARYAMNELQLSQLAATLEACRKKNADLRPLVPRRLGILSSSTSDLAIPAIAASALRHGINLECVTPGYGMVMQGALSPESEFLRSKPDAVLVAIDYRSLPLRSEIGNQTEADNVVRAALEYFGTIRAALRRNGVSLCIVQTIPPPPERLFGNLDRAVAGTVTNLLDRINRGIAETVSSTGDIVFDVAGLAESVGLAEWHSLAAWNVAKLPLSNVYLPLYGDHVARILAASLGKSRRLLVLDLDNTIWGGVIGDDGIDGIQCSEGNPQGEAFRSVQQYALELRGRGVLLAVSSKNTDEVARRPFREHPEMLLKEEHISVFQANWNDKATNIKAIAQELSLGLDSVVLLDDDVNERHLVRRFLPEVAVPELPSDPARYARTLSAAGYFESIAFSGEDAQRSRHYRENARRIELRKGALDLGSYLQSLRMELTFQPFDATGRKRITQLINKSNQYNLTTKRYTEAEILAIEQDPLRFTLQARLADAVGDSGMISAVICEAKDKSTWLVDTWLMSCRVLGRRVEWMVLREILDHARSRGIERLIGVYTPTARNNLAEDHYRKLGFSRMTANENGASMWALDVATAAIPAAPISVRRIGFKIESGQ
ncbi:MAG: HAD-IIIC family phosphatase [Candidatus Acidiferrales bacterium]